MELRSSPQVGQVSSLPRRCLRSTTAKARLDVSATSIRRGKTRPRRDRGQRAGQASQTTGAAAHVPSGDRSCRKSNTPSRRRTAETADLSANTLRIRRPKLSYTPESPRSDPMAFSGSPLRLKPEDFQSSTPVNNTASKRGQSQMSQTPSKPRQGRRGIAQESSLTSSQASASVDELSQHESQLSSDLSIELSLPAAELNNTSLEEEVEETKEEEDEELPCFLLPSTQKPACIKEGEFVWCKFRTYPFWPAVVKSVNHKLRKASIIWIDVPAIDKKKKGLSVSLRNLKPFDCEEANELACAAKANYEAVIDWSLELMNDYLFRIACRSFTGSFIEYWTHLMSYPVRRKYPQGEWKGLAVISSQELEEHSQCSATEESITQLLEEEEEVEDEGSLCLSVAAHNRANERLVHFIVTQRMVDQHLLAVIRGQQPSRWLCSFLRPTKRLQVKNYLEDEEQLDQVYNYLKQLFESVSDSAPCLANVNFMDEVRLAMDVLLPEAIISAIAGVDNISLKEAEEKYLNKWCISDREREEFKGMIGGWLSTNSVS